MQPLVIGLAGGSGSGKTTIARTIMERLGRERIVLIQHDAYYCDQADIPFEQRLQISRVARSRSILPRRYFQFLVRCIDAQIVCLDTACSG